MQEEEEAPQSEANAELLGAFKCTNIALEEEEEEEEEDYTEEDYTEKTDEDEYDEN